MESEKKQRPVHEVTLGFNGCQLKCAIWRHEQQGQHPRFTVSVSRAHRTKEGGKWLFDGFFQPAETLLLAHLLEETHRWIVANNVKEEPKND